MTEPQVWAVIGVLSATLVAFVSATIAFMNARLADLRRELEVQFAAVDSRFASVERELDLRFSRIDGRFDVLDRDVQAIAAKVFGVDRD